MQQCLDQSFYNLHVAKDTCSNAMYTSYLTAINVRSGDICPATFADKGPDQALRGVYTLFGGQRVGDHFH